MLLTFALLLGFQAFPSDEKHLHTSSVSDEKCVITNTTITGNSMQGLLWNGQKISVRSFGCGTPERYDHILFTHEETKNAVVKQLWGLPGDSLRVDDNGKFYINDVMVTTPFGKPYVLLGASKSRMQKLATTGPITGYLLIGQPGSLDSTRAGLIPLSHVLGYVKLDQVYVEGADENGPRISHN